MEPLNDKTTDQRRPMDTGSSEPSWLAEEADLGSESTPARAVRMLTPRQRARMQEYPSSYLL
jgi:hypothetical protein